MPLTKNAMIENIANSSTWSIARVAIDDQSLVGFAPSIWTSSEVEVLACGRAGALAGDRVAHTRCRIWEALAAIKCEPTSTVAIKGNQGFAFIEYSVSGAA